MKKVLLYLLLVHCIYAKAQNITFTINQAPCNNDGIVTANFQSNLIHPFTVQYYLPLSGNSVTHTVSLGYTDVLSGYSGESMSVSAYDNFNNYGYGSFSAKPFNVTYSVVPGTCPTPTSITATATGGLAPYVCAWYEGGNLLGTSNPLLTNLNNAAIDFYMMDANGCVTQGDSIYLNIQPNFHFQVTTTQASCTNGTASIGAIIGTSTPPYTYLWSNGANTASISGLMLGQYSVTVTDALGCPSSNFDYVNQSPSISTNFVNNPATCIQPDGSSIAFGSGGMPPYQFHWSTGSTTNTITNVPSGSYSITTTDANGCISYSYTYIASSTPITVNYTSTPSSCTSATGSATLSITGGTVPYTVTWYTFPLTSGTTINNLAPGQYAFKVVDATGCSRTGNVQIQPINIIIPSFSSTPSVCNQPTGTLSVSASGGTAPYSYSWFNGSTSTSINNLNDGSYYVTISDAVGCKVVKSGDVYPYSPIHMGLATTPTSCLYSTDGSVYCYVSGAVPPLSYSWSNGQTIASISGLGTGHYSLYITDANGCTGSATTYLGTNNSVTNCYCTITGTAYHDLNSNCVKDPGEPGVPNIQMHLFPFGYAYTNANGVYTFLVPTGNYILSENILGYYPPNSCQNNAIAINSVAAAGCTITNDFSLSMLTIHDLETEVWKLTAAVPGNPYNQIMVVSNNGTVTESTIIAGYKSDGQLNSPSILPSGFVPNGTNPNWYEYTSGFPSLQPGTFYDFNINYSTPTNIPINTALHYNDTVTHMAPMSNWLNDYSPWNNVDDYEDYTVGPFDPNFKEVKPHGTGPNGNISRADSILKFAIHFQNLGNWNAQNVEVIDTLDSDLNWATLEPGYRTHNCDISISESGIAKFSFKNILLPPKIFDEQGSTGMFTYSIHLKPHLLHGTQVTNNAAIYFDYNAPVITNKTLNTLDTTGINEISEISFGKNTELQIMPNPAKDIAIIFISNSDQNLISSLQLFDAMGRIILTQEINSKQSNLRLNLNLSELQNGFYFILVKDSNGKTMQQKLMVHK